jgi:hypothetical protein
MWINKPIVQFVIIYTHTVRSQIRDECLLHRLANECTQVVLNSLCFNMNSKCFEELVNVTNLSYSVFNLVGANP